MLLMGYDSTADWLCTQTESVQKDPKTIYTCGVGEDSFESEARKKARTNAIDAFETICNKTSDCRDYEPVYEPLRADCSQANNIWKCYTGFKVQVSNKKQQYRTKDDIKDQAKKIAELEDLWKLEKEKYENEQRIQELKTKIKNRDFKEKGDDSEFSLYPWVSSLGLSYGNTTVKEETFDFSGLNLHFEKRYWKHFGLKLNFDYLTGNNGKEVTNYSYPDKAKRYEVEISGYTFGLSFPIYFINILYLAPTVGISQTTYSYNKNVNYQINVEEKNVNQFYYGLEFGYSDFATAYPQWGWTSHIGIQNYTNGNGYRGRLRWYLNVFGVQFRF